MFQLRRTAELSCVLGIAVTLWLSTVVAPVAVSGRVLQAGIPPAQTHERITIADNRVAAGTVVDGTLTIRLEARTGEWYPDRDADPGVVVKAFAVEGGPLQIPGPLIRVPEGTRIRAIVRNRLADPLAMHGLYRTSWQFVRRRRRGRDPARGNSGVDVCVRGRRDVLLLGCNRSGYAHQSPSASRFTTVGRVDCRTP